MALNYRNMWLSKSGQMAQRAPEQSKRIQMKKIDRLYIVAHCGNRILKSMKFRYLSKSIFAGCKGDGQNYEYVNFRGAHFSKSTFKSSGFKGCDFWGTTFNKCKFTDALFQDCVFQGCKFKDCDFENAKIQYSAIVNTNTEVCQGMLIEKTTLVLKEYPTFEMQPLLLASMEKLRDNTKLRKTKVLWISNMKPNYLNIYLLRRKYTETEIAKYLDNLSFKDIDKLTTYGGLSWGLRNFSTQYTMK